MGQFKKNNAGRPKGAKNKTSQIARELYLKVIEGESEYIEESFKQLREEDAFKYLSVLNKFASYVLPKLTENTISSDVNHNIINLGSGINPVIITDEN